MLEKLKSKEVVVIKKIDEFLNAVIDNEVLKKKPYLVEKVRKGEIRLARFLKMIFPNATNVYISGIIKWLKEEGEYCIRTKEPTYLKSPEYIPHGDSDSCFVNNYPDGLDKSVQPFIIEFLGGKLVLVENAEKYGRFFVLPARGESLIAFNFYGIERSLFLAILENIFKGYNIYEVDCDEIGIYSSLYFNSGRFFLISESENLEMAINDFRISCPICGNEVLFKDLRLVSGDQLKYVPESTIYYEKVITPFLNLLLKDIRNIMQNWYPELRLYAEELMDYSLKYRGEKVKFDSCSDLDCIEDCKISAFDCERAVSLLLEDTVKFLVEVYFACPDCCVF
ncbi:MAG: hypothetical protein ABIM18_08185 [candidate division WOR-3 bacterium]